MTVAILLICISIVGTLLFSTNAQTLLMFSRVKLQDAFKETGADDLSDYLTENAERLSLTCSLYRILLNMVILLSLIVLFAALRKNQLLITDYSLVFIISMAIFSVFSIAIPHAWAKYAGEKVLSRTYKILIFFALIASPVLYFLKFYDAVIRRLAGVVTATAQEQQEEKQEEFLTDLEQQRMEGVVDEEEQEMIENVLELSDTSADEIMTPRTDVVAIDVESDLPTVLEIINSAGHSRVPVYENNIDSIIGFSYAKDLLAEIGKDPAQFELRKKIRKAYFVPETKPLRTLLHEFQNQKLHIAVVLDEYGGTAGIVTIEDVLEELVGEITDEYEEAPPEQIIKIDKDTIEMDARTYIDDANDQLELNLPEEEDYDTVGGFVFSHLGYIPKTGETFDYENLKFIISSAEARKVKRIRIHKISKQ